MTTNLRTESSSGRIIADLLAGSWRKYPPDLQISAEHVAPILPIILASGTASLVWRRLTQSNLSVPVELRRGLQQSFRQQAMQAATYELHLTRIFEVLRNTGIDPILIKGWAVSRLYPELGLRPCGDIDLCIAPEHHAKVKNLLNKSGANEYLVDLDHDEITKFDDHRFEELYGRSELVQLDRTEIRLLRAEDHLRLLCIHFLKHGGWRPLWLCDVAAALESRPAAFDWSYCLGKNRRRREWILRTLDLAHQLLGADLGDAPTSGVGKTIPKWLTSSVLKQWGKCHPTLLAFEDQIRNGLRRPREFMRYLRTRWPDPIVATVDANAAFDHGSRIPLQVRHCLVRSLALIPRMILSRS